MSRGRKFILGQSVGYSRGPPPTLPTHHSQKKSNTAFYPASLTVPAEEGKLACHFGYGCEATWGFFRLSRAKVGVLYCDLDVTRGRSWKMASESMLFQADP